MSQGPQSGNPGSGWTPESFAQLLSSSVVGKVIEGVKAAMANAPTKMYEVFRQTPTGVQQQQISLPQALCELTDQLKIHGEIMRRELKIMTSLSEELKKSRQLSSDIFEEQRRQQEEE